MFSLNTENVGFLYLEKYMLTLFGVAAFNILIPLGCLCFIIAVLWRKNFALKRASAKLALSGIAIFLVVPASVLTSSLIENTYQASVDDVIALAEDTAEDAEAISQESESSSESSPLDQVEKTVLARQISAC